MADNFQKPHLWDIRFITYCHLAAPLCFFLFIFNFIFTCSVNFTLFIFTKCHWSIVDLQCSVSYFFNVLLLLFLLHHVACAILVPPTRDQTCAPCIMKHWILTKGPPGKSLSPLLFLWQLFWDITHISYQKIYPFKLYNCSVFLVHLQNYASNTLMNFRTHSFSSQRTLYPSSVSLQSSLPRKPLWWLLSCVNLTGSQCAWIFGQTLLWVCLQRSSHQGRSWSQLLLNKRTRPDDLQL